MTIKQQFLTGNNIIDKYYTDFHLLVETAWRAYNHKSLTNRKKYLLEWGNMIRDIPRRNRWKIDRKDIEQQLYLLWVKYHKDYLCDKQVSHIRSYLIRRSMWGLRDWLTLQANVVEKNNPSESFEREDKQMSLLDIFGGREDLTIYERYILYLYTNNYTINHISDILGKHRNTISKELEVISQIERE